MRGLDQPRACSVAVRAYASSVSAKVLYVLASTPGGEGVIAGYRAVIDPAALGRDLEVLIDVEIYAQDRRTVEEFETTVASYEEVVEFRRMYGRPDHFLRVAVADHTAYEAFLMGKLSGLPAVLRLESHLTMKTIKVDG